MSAQRQDALKGIFGFNKYVFRKNLIEKFKVIPVGGFSRRQDGLWQKIGPDEWVKVEQPKRPAIGRLETPEERDNVTRALAAAASEKDLAVLAADEMTKPPRYVQKKSWPSDASPDWLAANRKVGEFEAKAYHYYQRGLGERKEEGYGESAEERKFYLASSIVLKEMANRLADKRDKGAPVVGTEKTKVGELFTIYTPSPSVVPEEKDIMRANEEGEKYARDTRDFGEEEAKKKHLQRMYNMALAITNVDKAVRRGLAMERQGFKGAAQIFYKRHAELGGKKVQG